MSLSSDDMSGDIDDEGYYYEVEEILADQKMDGVVKYLIKWKNYDKEFNTWEPEENLSCPDLLEEYLNRKKKRRRDISPNATKKKKKSSETRKDSKKDSKKATVGSTASEPLLLHHTMQSVLTTPILKNNPSAQSTASVTDFNNNNNNNGNGNYRAIKFGSSNKSNNKSDDSFKSTSVIHFSTNTPSTNTNTSSTNTTSAANRKLTLTLKPQEKKQSAEKKPVLALSGESSHIASGFGNKKRLLSTGQNNNKSLMDLVQAMSGKQPTKSPFQSTNKQPIPKRPSNIQRLTDDDAKRVRTEPSGSVSPPYSKYNTTANVHPSNRQTSSSSSTHNNNNTVSSSTSTTTPISSPKHINTTISTSSSHNNNNNTPTITATSHNYNVVSPTHSHSAISPIQNIVPSNHNTILPNNNNITSPSHNNFTSPSHSNTTSPVHKNSVANAPYKYDIPSRPPIWQGQIKKKSKPIIGVKLELVYDPWKLVNEAVSFLKTCELQIETFLPIERLSHTIRPENNCIMEAVAVDNGKYVVWSKFRGFLTINQCAGIVRSSKRPKEVLALAITSGLKGHAFRDPQKGLSVIYINGLIPDCAPTLNQLTYANDFKLNSNWKTLAGLLSFPKEFDGFIERSDVRFEVHGTTEIANWLKTVVKSFPSSSSTNINKTILLFDRFSDELFKENLSLKKFNNTTHIYEFGIYSLADTTIEPAAEVYPKSTGGFITTDVSNILANPDILDRMIETESKLKEKYQFSDWRVIIHNDFLNQIKYIHSTKATIEAVTRLLLLLNTNQIHIMESYDDSDEVLSTGEPKNVTMKWYSDIVRSYFDQYQGFIYVDDNSSMESYQNLYPSIDFLSYKNIQSI